MMRRLYGLQVSPDPWSRRVKVLIDYIEGRHQRWCGLQNDDGTIWFEAIPDGCPPNEHTIDISEQDAQAVFDALYRAGYRPRGGRDSEGVHEAQQQHIADLRNVVAAYQEAFKPRVYSFPPHPPIGGEE